MMKISSIILPLLAIGLTSAFTTPSTQRSFGVRLNMADDDEIGGKLVPVKQETVEFTAGIIGGIVGLAVGGPVVGAVVAAASNYGSKKDAEVGEVLSAVSKSSIQIYNYLVKLDSRYELLTNTKASLESALEKVKDNDNVNPETVGKVENALASTTSKLGEINEEYDLVGTGVTALGIVGDLVEKAVVKASELNEEYKLTDKAIDALKAGVSKASDAAGGAVASAKAKQTAQ